MAQYFKSQVSNYKLTKYFSERKTSGLSVRLKATPMLGSISISRGRRKYIGILLWNLTIMKKLDALQVKNKGQGPNR